ncbi:MAG: acetate/propionate family kinase [Xanthomonadaceae bacterium]|nr:acetate/propionate family kinase [Xanthomonadaceae bacterium]
MILTINAGSSSLRLAAFEAGPDGLHRTAAIHHARDGAGPRDLLQRFLHDHKLPAPERVVHRVVHGGDAFVTPCRIDAAVEDGIDRLAPLAPLHNPAALELIRISRELFGETVFQVAVFDTAFFHELPDLAAGYALPGELAARYGLRRYGFHGLAHQALWQSWRERQSPAPQGARIISLQLGSGCSISAIRDGRPLDTSMGFTPLEGLVMATRSGDLDPGLLLYLQRHAGLDARQLEEILNHRSGLLGLSGSSGDMRELLASDSPGARQAIGLYCYRAAKYIGAYLAVLGGAQAIVFGGGVGEHAPLIRARILENLRWAGIHLDPAANEATIGQPACISASTSPVSIWVLPVDEASLMAEQARALSSGR